jgi:hypothetical protein
MGHKPAAGTGKSLLVDLASILLSGQDAPVISVETGKEEFEKRLGSSLLAGDTIVSFDNCNAPLNLGLAGVAFDFAHEASEFHGILVPA